MDLSSIAEALAKRIGGVPKKIGELITLDLDRGWRRLEEYTGGTTRGYVFTFDNLNAGDDVESDVDFVSDGAIINIRAIARYKDADHTLASEFVRMRVENKSTQKPLFIRADQGDAQTYPLEMFMENGFLSYDEPGVRYKNKERMSVRVNVSADATELMIVDVLIVTRERYRGVSGTL